MVSIICIDLGAANQVLTVQVIGLAIKIKANNKLV